MYSTDECIKFVYSKGKLLIYSIAGYVWIVAKERDEVLYCTSVGLAKEKVP